MLSLSALTVAFAQIGVGGAGFYRMLFASILFFLMLKTRRIPVMLKGFKVRLYTALTGEFLAIDLALWHRVSISSAPASVRS
jgi:hypothetical protein